MEQNALLSRVYDRLFYFARHSCGWVKWIVQRDLPQRPHAPLQGKKRPVLRELIADRGRQSRGENEFAFIVSLKRDGLSAKLIKKFD